MLPTFETLQNPFSDFYPFKKVPKPYLVSENCRHFRARSFCPSVHTPLSLRLLSFCSARGREEQRFNSVKQQYYVASLILHDASIDEITAKLLSLSYVYLSLLRSLNGSRFSHNFIFIPLSDNRNSKIYQ